MAGLCAIGGLSACGSDSTPAAPSSHYAAIECAPYARQVTGIQLYGPAYSWWDAARGRYEQSTEPEPGSVLVFRQSRRLPDGHVSVVRRVDSSRQITVTQANWVHHHVAPGEPVIDVSPGNDWSVVRVWWAPAGQMGQTVYSTYGFIRPAPADRRAPSPTSDRVATRD